jgi:hypothetical protein
MKKIIQILTAIFILSSFVYAEKIKLSVDETNLAIQCINLAPVPNVVSAMEPLKVRDKIVSQAQDQANKNKDIKIIELDLTQDEANILLTCIQKAPVENVSKAEVPIKLAEKIIAQFNGGNEQQTKKETKKK